MNITVVWNCKFVIIWYVLIVYSWRSRKLLPFQSTQVSQSKNNTEAYISQYLISIFFFLKGCFGSLPKTEHFVTHLSVAPSWFSVFLGFFFLPSHFKFIWKLFYCTFLNFGFRHVHIGSLYFVLFSVFYQKFLSSSCFDCVKISIFNKETDLPSDFFYQLTKWFFPTIHFNDSHPWYNFIHNFDSFICMYRCLVPAMLNFHAICSTMFGQCSIFLRR